MAPQAGGWPCSAQSSATSEPVRANNTCATPWGNGLGAMVAPCGRSPATNTPAMSQAKSQRSLPSPLGSQSIAFSTITPTCWPAWLSTDHPKTDHPSRSKPLAWPGMGPASAPTAASGAGNASPLTAGASPTWPSCGPFTCPGVNRPCANPAGPPLAYWLRASARPGAPIFRGWPSPYRRDQRCRPSAQASWSCLAKPSSSGSTARGARAWAGSSTPWPPCWGCTNAAATRARPPWPWRL